jgi:hypothetical protein
MSESPDARIAAQIVQELIAQQLVDTTLAAMLERKLTAGDFKAGDWIALAERGTTAIADTTL